MGAKEESAVIKAIIITYLFLTLSGFYLGKLGI